VQLIEPLFRRDFFDVPHRPWLNAARWFAVASAAAIPLGIAPTNVFGGFLLLFLLIAGGYSQHARAIAASRPLQIALAFLLAILLGAIWSDAPTDDVRSAIVKHMRLAYFPIAILLLRDARWAHRAITAWMLAMLLTLVLSYVHAIWPFPLARATRENIFDDHFIFKHHITQNVMMSVFAVAALVAAIRDWTHHRKHRAYFWGLVAAAAVINIIFFVAGRTGYVTLLLNAVIAAIVLLPHRWRAVGLTALLFSLALLASVSTHVRVGVLSGATETLSALQQEATSSMGQRVEFAQRSIELSLERPWMGWGTGSYASEFCRVAKSQEWCRLGAYNPHNQYLFLAVQLGLLGVVLYLLWLLSIARDLSATRAPVRTLGYCFLATLIVHSLFDSPLYIAAEGAWYPLMLGVMVARASVSSGAARSYAAVSKRSTRS
jgi:O-antigen ligase